MMRDSLDVIAEGRRCGDHGYAFRWSTGRATSSRRHLARLCVWRLVTTFRFLLCIVFRSRRPCAGGWEGLLEHGEIHAGAGKLKHLTVKQLRAQQLVGMGRASIGRLPRTSNSADALTHTCGRSLRACGGGGPTRLFRVWPRGVFDIPLLCSPHFRSVALPTPQCVMGGRIKGMGGVMPAAFSFLALGRDIRPLERMFSRIRACMFVLMYICMYTYGRPLGVQ